MSLIDKMIRSAARPKSFWAMFMACLLGPVIGFPYVLLVNHGFMKHSVYGVLLFMAMFATAFCLSLYYLTGMMTGRYKDLEGLSWSELPW